MPWLPKMEDCRGQNWWAFWTCGQCDYVATGPGYLKTHKEVELYGIRYTCDQCDYYKYVETKLNLELLSMK